METAFADCRISARMVCGEVKGNAVHLGCLCPPKPDKHQWIAFASRWLKLKLAFQHKLAFVARVRSRLRTRTRVHASTARIIARRYQVRTFFARIILTDRLVVRRPLAKSRYTLPSLSFKRQGMFTGEEVDHSIDLSNFGMAPCRSFSAFLTSSLKSQSPASHSIPIIFDA